MCKLCIQQIPDYALDEELLKKFEENPEDSIIVDDEIKQAIANIAARKAAISKRAKANKESSDD